MHRLRSWLWFLTGVGFATMVIPPAGFWTVWAAAGTAGSASLLGYAQFSDDSLKVVSVITATAGELDEGYFSLGDDLMLYAPKDGEIKSWLQKRVTRRVRLVIEEVEN